MDVNENTEALLKVLKMHSDNIDKWIETLKQKKGASWKWTNPSTWPIIFTSKSEAKHQQPVSSSDVVPEHAHSKHDQDTYSPVLEEIKTSIYMLEKEIVNLLKSMEEQQSKATERSKKSTPTLTVQIYDRDGHLANDFMRSASQMMQNQFNMVHVKNVAEIDMKNPFLVLCQRRSRLQPDIDYAWENIKASFPNVFSSPIGQQLQAAVNSPASFPNANNPQGGQQLQSLHSPEGSKTEASSPNTTNPQGMQQLQAVSSPEGSKAEGKADLYAATIVIHEIEEFALPSVSSEYMPSANTIYKNMCIIDTAYTDERKFYECEMNAKAVSKLGAFLKRSDLSSV